MSSSSTGQVGVGVVRGPRQHRRHDQLREARRQRLVVESELARARRTVVVHDDVGRGEQPVERGAVVGRVEVEHDAALAAHPGVEPGGRPVRRAVGWLDGHDVGARLREHERRHRAGDAVRQIDDADAVEDPCCRARRRLPPSSPRSRSGAEANGCHSASTSCMPRSVRRRDALRGLRSGRVGRRAAGATTSVTDRGRPARSRSPTCSRSTVRSPSSSPTARGAPSRSSSPSPAASRWARARRPPRWPRRSSADTTRAPVVGRVHRRLPATRTAS